MSSSRKQKSSLTSIVIGFFLVLLALVSFGISTFFSIKKNFKGDNYNSVINVRYELDPYRSENPAIPEKTNVNLDKLKSEMNKIAEAYSKYLLDKKVSSENVRTEIVEDSDNPGSYHVYINTSLYNYKVESSYPEISNDDDKNKDVALSLAYYSNMDAGRFSIIYSDGYKDKFDEANLYMWDINQDDDNSLTDANSKIKLNAQQNKINVKLRSQFSFGKKEDNNTYAENSIKQNFYNAKNNNSNFNEEGEDDENGVTPFMIIIHNFNGMINEMNFITFICYQYNNNLQYSEQIRDAYWQLSDEQRQFAKDMEGNGLLDNFGFIDDYQFVDNHGFQKNIKDPLEQKELIPQTDSISTFSSSNFFYALQNTNDENEIEIGKSSGLRYDFLNKYILGIVNKDNFIDFLPDKNPTKTTIDSDGNWLTIPNVTNKYFTTSQLYKSMTDQKFSFPIWARSKDINSVLQNGITSNVNVSLINPDFNKSILQINNASLTTVIAIIISLLIIGIIVSVLYRIPGFVSFVWMIFPISLLTLIMFLSGFGLSLCLLVGVLVMMIVSSVSLIILLNKTKSNHINHKTLDQSIKFAFKHSIITILDLHVISLIAGVAMLFFPMGQIFALGMSLIVGSLLSFVSICGLNYLSQILIFGNDIGMYNFKWFSATVYDINSNEYDKRFEILAPNTVKKHIDFGLNKNGYVSKITINNNVSFKNKWFIPYVVLVLILTIIGIVLASCLNVINLKNFSAGTYLIINRDEEITQSLIMHVLNSLNSNWYNFKTNADYFTIESSSIFIVGTYEYDNLINALHAANITNFFVQNIDSKITVDFTLNCLWILLTFGALMSVYTLVRYNWYSVIPTFISFVLTYALTFGLISMFNIPINIYTSYAFIMIGIMNYLLMYSLISSIFSRYVRINPTLYNDLKSLYVYTISTFNECSIEIICLYITIVLIMLLFMPLATIFFTLDILISIVVIVLNTYIILPRFIYLFNNLHNMYRIRVRRIQIATDKNNLDKIDEELIDSININTRNRKRD